MIKMSQVFLDREICPWREYADLHMQICLKWDYMILKYFIPVFGMKLLGNFDCFLLFHAFPSFRKQGVIFVHFLWISDDDGFSLRPNTTCFGLG